MSRRRLVPPRDLLRFRASRPTWQQQAADHITRGCPALAREVALTALGGADDAEARRLIANLDPVVRLRCTELGADGPDAIAALVLHERSVEAIGRSDFRAATGAIRELLDLVPDCAPALNNLSLISWAEDRPDEAIRLARRVVDAHPDNVNGLANLTSFLFRRGQFAETEEFADRLRQLRLDDVSDCAKQAEAFSYLGDDAAVLGSYKRANAIAKSAQDPGLLPAILLHLAAVAEVRRGRRKAARELWLRALAAPGSDSLMRANLADLDNPPAERDGPWAVEAADWLGTRLVDEMQRRLSSRSITRTTAVWRRAVEGQPQVALLLPAILDRGSPLARGLALILIDTEAVPATPAIAEAVRSFVRGKFGRDDERLLASQIALRHDFMPNGSVKMWRDGRWQDTLQIGIEIHGEPTAGHSLKVERWVSRAVELQGQGKLVEAEALLKQALSAEPDKPDLHFNLAVLRQVGGRMPEAIERVRAIHARWPDYLFARCVLAETAAEDGDIAEARRLVDPLLLRHRMHFSEFRCVVSAMVTIALAEGEQAVAESWWEMLERSEPDHPMTAHLREKIDWAP